MCVNDFKLYIYIIFFLELFFLLRYHVQFHFYWVMFLCLRPSGTSSFPLFYLAVTVVQLLDWAKLSIFVSSSLHTDNAILN